MKSGDRVQVARPSNHLIAGQVIEVTEVIDKRTIEIQSGFVRKTIPITDVREIHLN